MTTQEAILEIIQAKPIKTQKQLQAELKARDISITLSGICVALKKLRIEKTEDGYTQQSSDTVHIVKLRDDAYLPTKAHPDDAGWDLRSVQDIMVFPGKPSIISTGIALQLPPQYEAQIRPRSGNAARFGLTVTNAPGTIDSGYQGEIKVIMHTTGDPVQIKKGMKIAQMVFQRLPDVSVLFYEDQAQFKFVKSSRGDGGLGSSDG